MITAWTTNKKMINSAHLISLYSQEWWCNKRNEADVNYMLEHTDIVIAGNDKDGNLCAFARVLTDRIYKALILDVIVRKDLRNKRIGHALMNQIFNHESLQMVKSFELYCPDKIMPFYLKMGFRVSESKLLIHKI